MGVAAIVSAYNEEENIGNVLKVLLKSEILDEVIVVDDGSKDRTAEISEKEGAKVIKIFPNKGKGNAMAEGVKQTQADIIVFFDADLIGLSSEHISKLVIPVLKGEAVMALGMREGGGWRGKISEFCIKIDPLSAIAGERAMKRFIFENLPLKFIQGFMIETALNYYCKVNRLPVKYFKLKGLKIIVKEKKWGLIRGFLNRLKMTRQLLKIRFLILRYKREFKTRRQNV